MGNTLGDKPSGRITVPLIRALSHPVRREALRLLHTPPNRVMSATEMSHVMTESRQAISKHLKVLRNAGAIAVRTVRMVRNVKETGYGSLVAAHPTLVAVLVETETEDASIRRDLQEPTPLQDRTS
jgi:DNA-binding transcriptional ArsR family regulator